MSTFEAIMRLLQTSARESTKLVQDRVLRLLGYIDLYWHSNHKGETPLNILNFIIYIFRI